MVSKWERWCNDVYWYETLKKQNESTNNFMHTADNTLQLYHEHHNHITHAHITIQSTPLPPALSPRPSVFFLLPYRAGQSPPSLCWIAGAGRPHSYPPKTHWWSRHEILSVVRIVVPHGFLCFGAENLVYIMATVYDTKLSISREKQIKARCQMDILRSQVVQEPRKLKKVEWKECCLK